MTDPDKEQDEGLELKETVYNLVTGDQRVTKCTCGAAQLLNGVSSVEFMGMVHSAMDPCRQLDMAEPVPEPFDPEKSNLVKHAKRELELAGIPEEDVENLVKLVTLFASMGHSGGQASWYITTLVRLLQYENLMSLTTDPKEWNKVSEEGTGLWQSARNPEAFSRDGGEGYYLLSETDRGGVPTEFYACKDHTKRG